MKALQASLTVLLDPRVIGPESTAEAGAWGGPLAEAAACDFVSDLLSDENSMYVLDWRYVGDEPHWREIEVEPEGYVEGSAFGPGPLERIRQLHATAASYFAEHDRPGVWLDEGGSWADWASEAEGSAAEARRDALAEALEILEAVGVSA